MIGAVLILVGAMALFWTGLRYSRLQGDAKVTPGGRFIFLRLRTKPGKASLTISQSSSGLAFRNQVQINVLDQSRVGDTLQRMAKDPETPIDPPIAREIAMRNGVSRVVFATVTRSDDKYRLDLDVQQPDNTPSRYRTHWKKSFEWESPTEAGIWGQFRRSC